MLDGEEWREPRRGGARGGRGCRIEGGEITLGKENPMARGGNPGSSLVPPLRTHNVKDLVHYLPSNKIPSSNIIGMVEDIHLLILIFKECKF